MVVTSWSVIAKSWQLKDHLRWVFRKNSMKFSVRFDYLLILLLQVAMLYYYMITCPSRMFYDHMSFQNVLWSHDLITWYDYLIPVLFISCLCCTIWYWRSNVQMHRKLFPFWGSHNMICLISWPLLIASRRDWYRSKGLLKGFKLVLRPWESSKNWRRYDQMKFITV